MPPMFQAGAPSAGQLNMPAMGQQGIGPVTLLPYRGLTNADEDIVNAAASVFDPLEMMKQSLLMDASASMTEAQAMEASFAEQIARRRRLMEYSGSSDKRRMTENLATGMQLSPSAYAGLAPHEITSTVADATRKAREYQLDAEQEAAVQRSTAADISEAEDASRRLGKKVIPSQVTPRPTEKESRDAKRLRAAPDVPAPYGYTAPSLGDIDEGPDGLRYTPNEALRHPAQERYAPHEGLRRREGPETLYRVMAAQGGPYAFANALAGQLTAQRLNTMGAAAPDHADPLSAMLYEDPAKLPVY